MAEHLPVTVTIKIDTSQLVAWAANLSSYKMKLAIKSGLNKASRAARTAAIEMISLDEGVSQARAKRSISPLSTASPSRLVTSWTASKQRIGILATTGAKLTKGVGLSAKTHRITGGGSSRLQVKKAFLLSANGGRVVMVRTTNAKGSKALKAIHAESPSTAMAQDDGAARKVWQKTAEVRLNADIGAAIQSVLNGAMPASDSGNNN